jgi:hypothetical protein
LSSCLFFGYYTLVLIVLPQLTTKAFSYFQIHVSKLILMDRFTHFDKSTSCFICEYSSFFFAVEENALIRKHYRKVPNKHKKTAQPNCKLTTSSTHRCAVAAASLEALDQRQSPGEREVADRRSRRTYTGERRRGWSKSPHLLLIYPDLPDPPSTEPSKGKPPTAPPRRCEDDGGSRSTAKLHRSPPPERRSTTGKHQPPRLHLQNAGSLRPKSSYTIYTTRDGDPPASRRRGSRRRPRDPTNLRRQGGVLRWIHKSPPFTVDGEESVQGRFNVNTHH